ncbi:hypothetical protein TVAG_401940 [Trichomonas vaginalis G3]|uniref:Uncharacterized protein n=1 Tax=Trichomonas vaginalis (strain ATCC PRA-98 / G3) TaxID=412133 RepID=A2DHV1_TRIV3|nr:hypothetical protein TVAGG3_0271420 [Trichomonas vaginalis G3]EAY19940.1 hypothetical protein TVAG_401940 [Trichomonas vaginalis G3]KAI5525890.1 hypothetical protein TVAGG3_0271420 [Trichomonas vaginalis G3]|eukprot:XP_001580926.1 hypothetical protein [Trichomonas vaginalis G3]
MDISDYKKRLDSLDLFIGNLEHRNGKKNSSKSSSNIQSPPIKTTVSYVNNKKSSTKTSKSKRHNKIMSRDLNNIDFNMDSHIEEDLYNQQIQSLRFIESSLKNKMQILQNKLEDLNSRAAIANKSLSIECLDITALEKRILGMETFNSELKRIDNEAPDEIFRLNMVVNTLESDNSLRKQELQSRKLKLEQEIEEMNQNQFNKRLNHTSFIGGLNPTQNERRLKIVAMFDNIDELIRQNMIERERIESEYRKKMKKISNLQKILNHIDNITISIHDQNISISKLDAEEKSLIMNKNSISRILNSSSMISQEINVKDKISDLRREIIENDAKLKAKASELEEKRKQIAEFENILNRRTVQIEEIENAAYLESPRKSTSPPQSPDPRNKTEVTQSSFDSISDIL